MINLLKRKPTWQPYHLLELHNKIHGNIYIHIHIYTCQNITPKHIWRKLTQLVNREVSIEWIWSSISHVVSLGPKCFHWTFTYAIAWFWSMRIFLCKMHWGSNYNYRFGSTYNIDHLITWSTYLRYFLSNDTWNISWTFNIEGSASW